MKKILLNYVQPETTILHVNNNYDFHQNGI